MEGVGGGGNGPSSPQESPVQSLLGMLSQSDGIPRVSFLEPYNNLGGNTGKVHLLSEKGGSKQSGHPKPMERH